MSSKMFSVLRLYCVQYLGMSDSPSFLADVGAVACWDDGVT